MRGALGFLCLLCLAWCLGEDRRAVVWRTVLAGVALQVALLLLFLHLPPARAAIALLARATAALQRATDAGTTFVFGYLGGGPPPFAETHPAESFILAFRILPLVLVISALSSLLYYWRVLPAVTRAFAALLRAVTGIGGPLALGAAVHVFVGMIEAPLLLRPYLAGMRRGELFALMSCGMAGIAGTVMVLYAGILGPVVPDALGNILIASVVSTPAALAVAALMVPAPAGAGTASLHVADPPVSSLDALTKGTREGVPILVGIVSVLLVTLALVSLVDAALAHLPALGGAPLTLQRVAAWPFRPVTWLIGVPWAQSGAASALMGTKTVVNEFAAYLQLAALPPVALGPRARLIMTYALCGFANFGSLGIMVGGMVAMVPERRAEIASLGTRSLLSGTIATCMSGALAGLLG